MAHLKKKSAVSTPYFGECREAWRWEVRRGWASWVLLRGPGLPGTDTQFVSNAAYDGYLVSSLLPCSPLQIMGRLCSPEGSTCDLLAIDTQQDIYQVLLWPHDFQGKAALKP